MTPNSTDGPIQPIQRRKAAERPHEPHTSSEKPTPLNDEHELQRFCPAGVEEIDDVSTSREGLGNGTPWASSATSFSVTLPLQASTESFVHVPASPLLMPLGRGVARSTQASHSAAGFKVHANSTAGSIAFWQRILGRKRHHVPTAVPACDETCRSRCCILIRRHGHANDGMLNSFPAMAGRQSLEFHITARLVAAYNLASARARRAAHLGLWLVIRWFGYSMPSPKHVIVQGFHRNGTPKWMAGPTHTMYMLGFPCVPLFCSSGTSYLL
ncbi:uncharacterized protein UV8b_04706 [Ustilaginoidea virens]|uniref:Uncharacterized protein n=1 Tax=Ustilaginoidea virens TaxID=1159556 RepID=A0A8E5HRT2_USTVR|nr:uncharacterized protein UV8b_04706 [Ustilaginoidea virens]QUC20465.1 hypothetical protein UV8b_04706 [Ustilaginoidea virens]